WNAQGVDTLEVAGDEQRTVHQRRVLQGAGGEARHLSTGDVDPVGRGKAGWKSECSERFDHEIGAPAKELRVANVAFGSPQVKAPVEIALVMVDAAAARRAPVDADAELAGQPCPVPAQRGAAMRSAHQALVVDPQPHCWRAKASIDVAQKLS